MKKLVYSIIAIAAVFAACSKENNTPVEEPVLIPKSFKVVSPETKTALDGVSIKWSANDEICVIAATTGNKYTFEIDPADAGKASATFTGSIDAADEAETTFYAVYPNQAIRSVSGGIIEFNKKLNNDNATQTAVAGGFDPAYSVMVATSDAGGTFSFSHRSAFLKLTVGNDNVSNINIKTGSTRLYGRPKVPIDDADMAYDSGKYSIEGAADNINLGGTLVNGSTYYVPIPIKNAKIGTITITLSFSDSTPDKSISTDAWKNNYFSVGKIYNLGTPTVSTTPEITAANITIEDTDESGVIDFTVSNPISGGVASYTVTTDGLSNADWKAISYNNSTGVGSIEFDCDANTDTSAPKTATVHIVYKDALDNILDETDVTVTQKKKPSGSVTAYKWSFASSDVMSSAWSGSGTYTWNSDTAGQTISYSYSKDQIVQYPSSSGVYCMKTTGDAKPSNTSGRRVFTYSAPCAGTLTIKGYMQGSNDGTLTVTLDGTAVSPDTGSSSGFTSTTDVSTCKYTITAAGTVEFYTAKKSYFSYVEFSF